MKRGIVSAYRSEASPNARHNNKQPTHALPIYLSPFQLIDGSDIGMRERFSRLSYYD